IPPQGFWMYRQDIRPDYGVSRGGAKLQIFVSQNHNNYLFYMPPSNFYLSQHQLAQFAGAPAYVTVHFDCHFPIDAFGLPGGFFNIQTPASVVNDPLPGSAVELQTWFHITATVPGLGEREVGTAVMQANFPLPNQVFSGVIPRPVDFYRNVLVPNLP